MSKVYYPIEEQLERIMEETDFVLQKPASEMDEEELLAAEREARKAEYKRAYLRLAM